MKISPCNMYNYTSKVFFGNIYERNDVGKTARNIERELYLDYGINANFKENDFVAKCALQTVKIFEKALGREYLPKEIKFESFCRKFGSEIQAYAEFDPNDMAININSDLACYNGLNLLTKERRKGHHFIFDNEKSTYHPLHSFIHEFAHCAHFININKHNTNAYDIWQWLTTRKIDKREFQDDGGYLGKYAKTDLSEYFAEKLTKEILEKVYRDRTTGKFIFSGDKSSLRCIVPDNVICGADINTYNLWRGDRKKLEDNLNERTLLSMDLEYIEGYMRYDTL